MTALVNNLELSGGSLFHPPVRVHAPVLPSPLIVCSPHSGRDYPAAFLERVRLPAQMLRQAEDAHMDELMAFAPDYGATFIEALFPRSYLDPNRAEDELDPSWLTEGEGQLTERASAGLGIVPSVIAEGVSIYKEPLTRAEAEARITALYRPYHRALRQAIESAKAEFGHAVLLDMHSMPPFGPGYRRLPDMVLGNRFGASCREELPRLVERSLSRSGYSTVRNRPYAGGFTTAHYGRPGDKVQVLQIELNRDLYLDCVKVCPGANFARVQSHMKKLVGRVAGYARRLATK